jgi:hypothetical protein
MLQKPLKLDLSDMITFTFRAFSRCSYPKQLTKSTFSEERETKAAVGTVRMFIEPSAKH